jgi:hypothetical protein
VAEAGEVVGDLQAGGAGADDGDLLPGGCGTLDLGPLAVVEGGALEAADGHRLALDADDAGVLAGVEAGPSEGAGDRVGLEGDGEGLVEVAVRDGLDVLRRLRQRGAGEGARLGLAVDAAQRLGDGQLARVAEDGLVVGLDALGGGTLGDLDAVKLDGHRVRVERRSATRKGCRKRIQRIAVG